MLLASNMLPFDLRQLKGIVDLKMKFTVSFTHPQSLGVQSRVEYYFYEGWVHFFLAFKIISSIHYNFYLFIQLRLYSSERRKSCTWMD